VENWQDRELCNQLIKSSHRNPQFVERYEDVVFDLETPLNTTVGNGAHQKRVIFALLLTIPVK